MGISEKEKQWYNYPNVIFTGILVLYLACRGIIALFNS